MSAGLMAQAEKRPALAMAEVMAFVHHELDLLDQRKFEAWAELFTDDGYYWAPVKPGQDSPLTHVSLFFDDKRTMATRIMRLRHPRIYVQNPPSHTIYLTSNFRDLEWRPDGDVDVRCNFAMFEFRLTKGQTIYGGTYDYRLAHDGEGALRIRHKKVQLANSEDSFPSLAVWF